MCWHILMAPPMCGVIKMPVACASIPMKTHIHQRLPGKILVKLLQHKVVTTRPHVLHSSANVRGYQDARRLRGRRE